MVARLAVGFAALGLAVVVSGAAAGVFKAPSAHLLPADPSGAGDFGVSVAVSADGSTALVGGDRSGSTTAVAVYVRSGSDLDEAGGADPDRPDHERGLWCRRRALGGREHRAGRRHRIENGRRVRDRAEVARPHPGLPSAVWVFTRSGTTWTQQGPALSPPSARGVSGFGASVALSADGNTALVGAKLEAHTGVAWVFTRSGSIWKRQGTKLTPSDESGRGELRLERRALLGRIDRPDRRALRTRRAPTRWATPRTSARRGSSRATGSTWKQQGAKLTGPGRSRPRHSAAPSRSPPTATRR